MNERITIYKKNTVIEAGRRTEKENILYYKCWATVLSLYGNDLYNSVNLALENAINFKIRYCKKIDNLINKDQYIIEWRGKKYCLYYVDFLDYNKQFVILKAKEII